MKLYENRMVFMQYKLRIVCFYFWYWAFLKCKYSPPYGSTSAPMNFSYIDYTSCVSNSYLLGNEMLAGAISIDSLTMDPYTMDPFADFSPSSSFKYAPAPLFSD